MLKIDQIESMNTALTQITGVLGLIINVTAQGANHENRQIHNATWMVVSVVKDVLNQLEAPLDSSWEKE